MKQDKYPNPTTKLVKLWDPALRIFHWALAICVVSAWCLGRFGPDIMTLHFYFGYAALGLLAFRLIWGLFGPSPARFSHMIHGPRTIVGYGRDMFQRKPSYWPGHNPVGSLAAWALLLIVLAQAGTGLFVDADDYVNVGPLASMLDSAGVRLATQWHHLLANILAVLVGLHLFAVLFYKYWKREDLITAMITGWKEVKEVPSSHSE
ncbi:cytochrome b/b6 domain-containing protein [Cohaesibacter gelatinilyticus]|uniref:Cytochrome b n=1 Tax=Cohaesibacter gelatinilyticus TaxID=372072 RepID=A0A285NDY6_9HYPH|nr:cytochrome b/b6 domain-containing protein [Cohaesibacter gelatinilyticus]SNZ07660.1 Cytochrome b [Cohaesibacter gelatinilyticus]